MSQWQRALMVEQVLTPEKAQNLAPPSWGTEPSSCLYITLSSDPLGLHALCQHHRKIQ